MAEILLEAVSDESVVLGDIVDDRAKAGKTGGDDSFGVEENQLHAGFLQLMKISIRCSIRGTVSSRVLATLLMIW